jgi:hypothetical protein
MHCTTLAYKTLNLNVAARMFERCLPWSLCWTETAGPQSRVNGLALESE